ncbi:MAG TPA: hypothetical protein VGI68_01075, partial [Mycobacterium sp.]
MTTTQDADRAVHRDIRQYLDELDRCGLPRRVARPTNKDTEVMPLVHSQFRGLDSSQRTGWLFKHLIPDAPILRQGLCGRRSRRDVSTDDGIGGADSRNGSGLLGLTDRVEALGGHLQISSPAGKRDIAPRRNP